MKPRGWSDCSKQYCPDLRRIDLERMAINWGAIKAEYVNFPSLTFASIAKKYGVHPVSLRSRAAKENWTAEREAKATKLLQMAPEKSVLNAVEELAQYNADLQMAKALRSLAARRMSEGPLEARDIRVLAGRRRIGATRSAPRAGRVDGEYGRTYQRSRAHDAGRAD
jgi:transposase-like protein